LPHGRKKRDCPQGVRVRRDRSVHGTTRADAFGKMRNTVLANGVYALVLSANAILGCSGGWPAASPIEVDANGGDANVASEGGALGDASDAAARDAPAVNDAGSGDVNEDASTEPGDASAADANDAAAADAESATVCFDGGPAPTDWATVYEDLFGPTLQSKGNCGSSDCHGAAGGGPGNFTIDPWTSSATYRALTRQQTNATGNGILVDLSAGPASAALLGNPALTPLAWFGAHGGLPNEGNMPYDDPVADPCAAAEVTAWLSAGAPGPTDDAGAPDASTGGVADKLTLVLDPSLDTDADTTIVTSIASAVLVGATGSTVKTATVARGEAVFDLTAVAAGDYFIRVNGHADDLVPTRIDNPRLGVGQRVGRKLRASVIGPAGSPLYRINTWSAGQAESPVAQYSNGAIVTGEQAYVIVTYDPPKVEFRVLGTGTPLTTFSPAMSTHPSNDEPFDQWMLVSNGVDGGAGPTQHGVQFTAETADGGAPSCTQCHMGYDAKPAIYGAIKPGAGWCYRCHYGPVGGDSNGFVNATK
jgi:hypothetical protein